MRVHTASNEHEMEILKSKLRKARLLRPGRTDIAAGKQPAARAKVCVQPLHTQQVWKECTEQRSIHSPVAWLAGVCGQYKCHFRFIAVCVTRRQMQSSATELF